MISIERLEKRYSTGFIPKKVAVLKGITLEVHPGEVFGFLGPNGAGKTTTIKILMNLIRPTKGTARIDGIDVRDPRARRSVGYLPEQPWFYTYLTGIEFLDYAAQLFGIENPERKKRVRRLLEQVGLADDGAKQLGKYSRGMLQRIGIAQALINDPDLLVLDEPLSGLDPVGRREITRIVFEQKKQGKTIFFSSHILSDAQTICDRVGILNRGKLVASGDLQKILERESTSVEIEIHFSVNGGSIPAGFLEKYGETGLLRENLHRLRLEHKEQLNAALRTLIDSGAEIQSVQRHRASLEDIFMRKVAGTEQ